MTDDKMKMNVETAVSIVLVVVLAGVCWALYLDGRGIRYGACVELCRPAKFDVDQNVNGGCLCIGSDKILRRRPAP
jgi:hypothetical protein